MKRPIFWKKVKLDDRKLLPTRRGVYAVMNWRCKVFYIGKSGNIKDRWAGRGHHRYRQASRVLGCKIAYLPCRSHSKVEAELIARYSPPWNNTAMHRPKGIPWVAVAVAFLAGLLAAVVFN